VLLYPLFLFLFKRSKDKGFRLLVLLNFILSLVFIIYANYVIAILIIFTYLSILLIYRSHGIYKFLLIAIIPASLLLAYLNIDFIEKKTYFIVEMTSLKYKHTDFFNIIKGKDDEYNTASVRLERYTRSIKLFIENPLTGTFSFNDIGKHSTLFDQFAQFGLFFGLIFTSIIFRTQFLISAYFKKNIFIRLYFLGLVLIGLLNNYGASIGVAIVFLTCLTAYKYTTDNV
jgi:hypothetical protein